MNATVVAAIIAGGLTLIGTVATQILGRRATKRDIKEQGEQLNRTLAEQRTRTLNERFSTAADKLGSDKPPAVRLAGVYAMAGLADDWPENRQTCVDVLCAYLRMPYEPDPGEKAPGPERLDFRASREVRHTVIRVITAHLQDGAAVSWQGLNYDFTGVVFDGGDFNDANFSSGEVSFAGAGFPSGDVGFYGTKFSGANVYFSHARFSGGTVGFDAEFSGGKVIFSAEFSGGTVYFSHAKFCGGKVSFFDAEFSGAKIVFDHAKFSGEVDFGHARFTDGEVSFYEAEFCGGKVRFEFAEFYRGEISFNSARFSSGEVSFKNAEFSVAAQVDFSGVYFSGTQVDFSSPGLWARPPKFASDTPPPGVTLPSQDPWYRPD